jgi:hypothetical protein
MNPDKNQAQTSYSITMDLENLRKKYSNLLIKYQAAVAEYNTYLNEQQKMPCKKFSIDSRGIDNDCVNYIWKKAGCGTGSVNIANDEQTPSFTLGTIIFFSWILSTDERYREQCYGTSTKYNTSTSPDFNINSQSFGTIKGMAFPGTGNAFDIKLGPNQQYTTSKTLQECIASCSSSPNCTGATFVSNKCMIRTGDTALVSSSPDSYAIIPKEKQLLLNMEDINKEMLDTNAKIENIIKTSTDVYDKTIKDSYIKNKELVANYEKLLDERRSIAEKLNQYETLDNVENERQMTITKNYYTYILLTILAVVSIILFYKIIVSKTSQPGPIIQSGGKLGTSAYYIVFGLVLFVIILSRSTNY